MSHGAQMAAGVGAVAVGARMMQRGAQAAAAAAAAGVLTVTVTLSAVGGMAAVGRMCTGTGGMTGDDNCMQRVSCDSIEH